MRRKGAYRKKGWIRRHVWVCVCGGGERSANVIEDHRTVTIMAAPLFYPTHLRPHPDPSWSPHKDTAFPTNFPLPLNCSFQNVQGSPSFWYDSFSVGIEGRHVCWGDFIAEHIVSVSIDWSIFWSFTADCSAASQVQSYAFDSVGLGCVERDGRLLQIREFCCYVWEDWLVSWCAFVREGGHSGVLQEGVFEELWSPFWSVPSRHASWNVATFFSASSGVL